MCVYIYIHVGIAGYSGGIWGYEGFRVERQKYQGFGIGALQWPQKAQPTKGHAADVPT